MKHNWGIPTFFALANALFLYFPYRDRLVGWGDDPFFMLWLLEFVWRTISSSSAVALFTSRGWNAPIFFPHLLTLGFSENQIYPGLLSWPLRVLTGNGTFTLNLLAAMMNLAAFIFASLWLREIGVKRLYAWGGLAFAACGWIQSQSAHYQNICIFVFPLALWLWAKLVETPSAGRAALCAAGFGWIIGWNGYYQIFANFLLVILALYESWRRPKLRAWCLGVVIAAVLLELPLVRLYLSSRNLLGAPAMPLEEFRNSSAQAWSFLSHSGVRTLLSRLIPLYPLRSCNIEASGFIGLTWAGLLVAAALCRGPRERRLLAAAAFAFYWASLGPDFLLFGLLRFFPGMNELRAVGRFQILVVVASLPAILLFLEEQPARRRVALMTLVLLELVPGDRLSTEQVPESYFRTPSAFSQRIANEAAGEPLLVFPQGNSRFQLYSLQTTHPLLDGYSGRFPPNYQLLGRALDAWGWTEERQRIAAALLEAPLWVSINAQWNARLAAVPFLRPLGCFNHYEFRPCVFAVAPSALMKGAPRLRLDRDFDWEYQWENGIHRAILRSRGEGLLSFADTAECVLRSRLSFKVFSKELLSPIPVNAFTDVRLKKGDVLLERISKQAVFRLPETFRPQKRYWFDCQMGGRRR